VVENLAITEGLPMPKVYIVNDPAPNAFATGRDPQHASVAATTGILELLTDDELEGVMAHEMGHVKNYDIRVSMIVFGLVVAVGFISDMFLRIAFFGGNRNSGGGNPIVLIFGLAAFIVAPLIAGVVQAAVSRQREYLADATGAAIMGRPEPLANALETLSRGAEVFPMRVNPAAEALFIVNPLHAGAMASLFATHPPLEERVRRLRALAV